jgi:predicted nucleic acid-binding protein
MTHGGEVANLGRAAPIVVVDASAMVEVLAGDPDWIERLGRWQSDGAMLVAPAHFGPEMANALLLGVHLEPLDAIGRLRQLFEAGVELVDRGLEGLFDSIELAARHGLTVYDAAYLQLVLDVDGELATCDRALAKAARVEAVTVIG